jgi:hypothetical protein
LRWLAGRKVTKAKLTFFDVAILLFRFVPPSSGLYSSSCVTFFYCHDSHSITRNTSSYGGLLKYQVCHWFGSIRIGGYRWLSGYRCLFRL